MKVNSTTEKFHRASRDNCLYSPEVFSGPFKRPPYSIAMWFTALLAVVTITLGALSW